MSSSNSTTTRKEDENIDTILAAAKTRITHNPHFYNEIERMTNSLTNFPKEQIIHRNFPSHEEILTKLNSLSPAERQEISVQHFLAKKFSGEIKKNSNLNPVYRIKCPFCWVGIGKCHCEKFAKVDSAAQTPSLVRKYRVIIFYHNKELFRSSNTAKILLHTLQDTRFYVSGLAMHEKEMERKYLNKPNTAVLFPSQNAQLIPEFVEAMKKKIQEQSVQAETASSSTATTTASTTSSSAQEATEEDEDDKETLNIILLDGTWGNAKNLNGRIPAHVPRIQLSTSSNYTPLFNALRKQSMQGRISTLEALVLCLVELGENEQVCNTLLENLKLLIHELKDVTL